MKKNTLYVIIGVLAGLLAGVLVTLILVGTLFRKDGGTSGTQTVQNSAVQNSSVQNSSVQVVNGTVGGTGTEKHSSSEQSGMEQFPSEPFASQQPAAETKILPELTVEMTVSNSWQGGDRYYSQYDITVTNESDKEVSGWQVRMKKNAASEVTQAWNCETSTDSEYLYVMPISYNEKLAAGKSTAGMGIIVSDKDSKILQEYEAVAVGSAVQPSKNQDGTGTQNHDGSQNTSSNGHGNPQDAAKSTAAVPSGRLSVKGTQLVNEAGEAVQLRGVSTHGLAWFPEYVNYESFRTLKEDWGVNVVRLAMYTAESGGYCTGGDRDQLKALIDNGVNYATDLGLYVIIDWHILSDGNPQTHQSEAAEFFREMSAKYAGHTNVIYEVCNEPQNVSWNGVIKPYAQEMVNIIRENDKNAVIIVGTNTWSQDVTDVAGDELEGDNLMYALHFYAATHTQFLRDKLISAYNAGVPIFVSECSICDASGNGRIDYRSANEWLSLLNENSISFVGWSLCNKNETSALIQSGCKKVSGWSEEELTDTGKWFRKAIRNE